MKPKEVVLLWIDAFNKADCNALVDLYHEEAINHQVANGQVEGKSAIKQMFQTEFANADMVCLPENIFEDRWGLGHHGMERPERIKRLRFLSHN